MMHIKLEKFEGPLELLAELIESQKLSVTDVALAAVTDQYLEAVGELQHLSMNELVDFLVVASRLLLIKSKALLPTIELSPEEEQEVVALKYALQEYQRYKEKTRYIQERAKSPVGIIARTLWQGRPVSFVSPQGFSITMANELFAKSLAIWERFVQPKEKQVLERAASIEQKIQEIIGRIQTHARTTLRVLVNGSKKKGEIIVAFLALLFLFKKKMIYLEQTDESSDIVVKNAATQHETSVFGT